MKEWTKNKTFFRAFAVALRGVREGYAREANVRKQFWIFPIVVLAAIFFRVSAVEWMFIVLSSAVILGLELVNTAIEEIEDVIWPEYREAVRRSKDMAAGAVLVAALAAIVIGVMIFLPHVAKLVY